MKVKKLIGGLIIGVHLLNSGGIGLAKEYGKEFKDDSYEIQRALEIEKNSIEKIDPTQNIHGENFEDVESSPNKWGGGRLTLEYLLRDSMSCIIQKVVT